MMHGMKSRFDTLPSRLQACSEELEIAGVPCLLVREGDTPRPFLFWMHGRTADKELDPGRYLRCVRKGIHVCAVDLPGHGQRFDPRLQKVDNVLDLILQMSDEIDGVLEGLDLVGGFELQKAALGGMSAGGLVTITRLLREHQFQATVLEGTGGAWEHLRSTPICSGLSDAEFSARNPMYQLDNWKDIPVKAFHNRHDERIPFSTEEDFIEALQRKSKNPEHIELVSFDYSGAPEEHMGFGRESAFVKEVQVEFLAQHLLKSQEEST